MVGTGSDNQPSACPIQESPQDFCFIAQFLVRLIARITLRFRLLRPPRMCWEFFEDWATLVDSTLDLAIVPAISIPRVRPLVRPVSGYLDFPTRKVMSGICNDRAGAVASSTLRSISCAGLSASAIFVRSRITLRRPCLATFGSCVIRQKLLVPLLGDVNSMARSDGSILRANSRDCVGVIPLCKKLGRALPDLCAPSDVVFKIPGVWRSFDGRNPVRSARSQSSKIVRDDACELDGNVNIATGSLAMFGLPVGPGPVMGRS